ncbi:competence protein CoiA family protein [Sphingomonas aquatilis]
MTLDTAPLSGSDKATFTPPVAIPFVVTPDGALCDATLVRRSWVRDFISRAYFRCACCGEKVVTRCGFKRPLYFAHFPATENTTDCAWRVAYRGIPSFDERNPDGDDGPWHVKAQLQIMTVLNGSGIACVRNDYVRSTGGSRKPDISCEIAGQSVHFEVQSSPTSAPSAAQRTERDFRSLVSTTWVVNAARYLRHIEDGSLPCWIDNIASFGGGQLWMWDDDCYDRSLSEGSLWMKRASIQDPDAVFMVCFEDHMPYVLPVEARLRSSGSVSIAFPPGHPLSHKDAAKAAVVPLLAELGDQLRLRLLRFRHSYRIDYPIVRLNTGVLDFLFPEGDNHTRARMIFYSRWSDS